MKYLVFVILLFFFNVSQSQVALLKNDKSYLIGEVRSDLFREIYLGYEERNSEIIHYIEVNRRSENICNERRYRIEFYANKEELDYLYSLILDAFKQNSKSSTELLIGTNKIVISTDLLMEQASYQNQLKNPYRLFSLEGCSLFQLNLMELRKLFNK